MVTIKLVKKNGSIHSLEADGHCGYGVKGEDIVCAGVSSIMQTALLGLLQVAGIPVDFVVDDEKGYLKFTLPDNLSDKERHDAEVILSTMWLGISDLREGFSDFIELEEI